MTTPIKESQDSTQLNLDFTLGDKLVQFFLRNNWSSTKTGLVAFIVFLLPSVLIALLNDALLPNSKLLALSVDSSMISEFVVIPVVWGYYIWISKAPHQVLEKLERTGILVRTKESTRRAQKVLATRTPVILAIVIALSVGYMYYVTELRSAPEWHNANPALLAIRTVLVWIPMAYAISIIGIRIIINARVFKFMLNNVILHPLHPDGAGGLRPLGQYALKITYLLAMFGFAAIYTEYQAFIRGALATEYAGHLATAAYVILTPLAFFAPLTAAHDVMRRAKEKLIFRTSQQFNQDFSNAINGVSGSAVDIKESMEKIEHLQALHKVASSFPVWPFDLKTIQRFLFTISAPFLPILFTLFSDWLINFLTQ